MMAYREAEFLDNREGANAERLMRLWMETSRRGISKKHQLRCVCPLRHGLENIGSEKKCCGVCATFCLFLRYPSGNYINGEVVTSNKKPRQEVN